MVLDASLLNNPEKRVAPSLHLGVVAIEKGAFGSPLTTVVNFTYLQLSEVCREMPTASSSIWTQSHQEY